MKILKSSKLLNNLLSDPNKNTILFLDKVLDKADKLKIISPEKGIHYLLKAQEIYKRQGYNFENECKINDLCLYYMNLLL